MMGVQHTSCAAGMHHSSMGLVEYCQHAQPDWAKESTCMTEWSHLRLLPIWQLQTQNITYLAADLHTR